VRRNLTLAAALLLVGGVACATEPATPTPVYVATNPTLPLYATWSPGVVGAGYVEIVFTPSASAPSGELAWSDPPTATGALRVYSSPAVGVWEPVVNFGQAGQIEAARMDTRRVWVAGRKVHYLVTWWPTADGGYALQAGVQGQLDYFTALPSTSVKIAALTAMWIGKTVAGATVAGVTVQRFAVGAVRVSATQARNMAAAAGCTATKYGFVLGDSITNFYDGYGTHLGELMGASGGVVLSNWGWSGDTTSMILARLGDVGGPLTVPEDYAVILGGTNDVLRLGNSAASTEQVLAETYGWIKARVGSVVVVTTPPIHNTDVWSSWDTAPHLAQQTLLNAWIAAEPGVTVVDAYSLFNLGDGSFHNYPSTKQYSYDGVHPTGLYENNVGNPNGSDTLAAAIYSALGSPSF
jgi:lysophospholipase L1-like esterase